jgi:hypothetical protein
VQELLLLLLLNYHEPSLESFALCFKSLLMSLMWVSKEFASEFNSARHLSSSGSYPLDLSDLVDPTSGNATAGLTVIVYSNPQVSPQGKLGIPWDGF